MKSANKHYDTELNVVGLYCPEPLIRTKKELSLLAKFSVLRVIVTDPSFQIDCEVFTRQTGHKLLDSWKEGTYYYFLIQKS